MPSDNHEREAFYLVKLGLHISFYQYGQLISESSLLHSNIYVYLQSLHGPSRSL